MAVEPPSGTVTFVVTLIDGSTARRAEVPGGGATGVAVHDAIAVDTIGRHGGFVFATRDDGLSAAFATAAEAAEAASELQGRLTNDLDRIGCGVRVGLHTGEAVEHGRTYEGPEVERAARLTAMAHPGQVVVSETTELLLRDRAQMRSLGEHRLRDLDRRMTVHQLLAEGLRAEFSELRSGGSEIGNLPEQRTSFVGRDALLVEVAELVRANGLVTLGGTGGVGKTRLALEVGAGMGGEFPDGVWFVDLASVGDPASVPAAIASTLGILPRGRDDLLDTVTDALVGRRMLLLLDNCEHVLPAVSDALGVMLARPGPVRVLVTSREYLWTPGETLVNVVPLAVEGDLESDAVQLFVARARTARPDFGVHDPRTAAAVTEICRTLDGLPLGIELAAARMAAMSAADVRDRLGARFRLLRGADGSVDRQATLDRAVGWSYDLLDPAEQDLLRKTSVFTGGFDLAGLTSVARVDDVDALARLDSLVRKSLVVAEHGVSDTRYRLYETIRQFAEDRLGESGGLDRVRDLHAQHFAVGAATRWDTWDGPGWRDAVDWVAVELGNLRTAFRWSSGRRQVEVATDIAAHAALMGFSVELFETVSWAEQLLEAATTADVPRLPRLCTAAGYACFVGRADAAMRHAHLAARLESQAAYDACEPGYATFVEALGQVYSGHLDHYVELTASVARAFGGHRGYALASYVDGLQASGRVDEALDLVEDSVAVARSRGNPYWIAYALWIAGLALSQADRQRALATWDEAVDHVRQHGVHFFDAFLARDAGRLHSSDGDADRALELFGTAVLASQKAGNVAQLVITLACVPALLERLERVDPAMTLVGVLSQTPAAHHHVPELAEVEDRLVQRLGAQRSAELRSSGASLELGVAATWIVQELAEARRDLGLAARPRPAGLSPREIEVLRLISEGRTTSEIAVQLFISAKTADHHIQHIYTKIGASNRAAATRWALQQGIVADAPAR